MLAPVLALVASANSSVDAAPYANATRTVPEDRLLQGHTDAPTAIDEPKSPVLVQLTYTSEVMSNASGGLERGTRYLDNLD